MLQYLIPIIVIGVILINVVLLRTKRARVQEEKIHKEKRFEEIFEIKPTRPTERTPGEQEVINRVLVMKADTFFKVSETQTTLETFIKDQRSLGVSDPSIVDHIQSSHNSVTYAPLLIYAPDNTVYYIINSVRRQIEECERYFWEAHGLAKYFNYEVTDSIKEYRSGGMMA